jgi:MFS family permease
MLGVTLAVALTGNGFSPVAIGALITIASAGDFCGTYLIGIAADRWGRRTLIALALIMAITGVIFTLTRFYPALALAAFFGVLGSTNSETAPFLPIEQAMLPQASPADRRTALFARYTLVASLAGALGSLAAALPDHLRRAADGRAGGAGAAAHHRRRAQSGL